MKSTNHAFHQAEGGGDAGGDGEPRAGAHLSPESRIDSDMVPEDHCSREEVEIETTVEKWRERFQPSRIRDVCFQRKSFPTCFLRMEGQNDCDLKIPLGTGIFL